MKKVLRIVCVAVMLLLSLSLFACQSVNITAGIELARHKADAKEALESYAEEKGQDNYSAVNWAAIGGLVAEGKTAIDAAKSEVQVDSAVATAKIGIDAVPKDSSNLEWTNEQSVYAVVKAQYVSEVLANVEDAFKNYKFKDVYVRGKTIATPQTLPLTVLFVLDESGVENQKAFEELLHFDERISATWDCRDLPFETVDTRYLDVAKDIIEVDEVLEISMKGFLNAHHSPFEFNGVWVTLTNFNENKTYKSSDFPQVKVAYVEGQKGKFFLKLSEPSYFNVIKAADALSRVSTIKSVEFDYGNVISPPPPIWKISDRMVAEFVDELGWVHHDKPVTIIGLKAGKVTISLDDVRCEITVKAKNG